MEGKLGEGACLRVRGEGVRMVDTECPRGRSGGGVGVVPGGAASE